MSSIVAVETVRLYTYKNVIESGYFDVPKDWLQKVINEMGYVGSVDSFLDGYTWDDSHFIYEHHMVEEWCSICDHEVKLPELFQVHKCPNCHESMLPCAQCIERECNNCPLEK